jgi:proteasome lid subunit RPN8/RPN11
MEIKKDVFDQIVAQAREELPNESCGYFLGTDGEVIDENYRMTNVDASPEHFSFAPKEQFGAINHARKTGKKVIANWHSHPASPARPSQEDIRLAYDPNILYFIVSLAAEEPVLNGYRIVGGEVTKLDVAVID